MAERRRGGWRTGGRKLVALGVVAAALCSGRGQSAASSGDGTLEPNGRGLQLLRGREAILLEQSAKARRIARERARNLYRLLRAAALERPAADSRAVALSTAVLARDLAEARALRAELERVRAERTALQDSGCTGCPAVTEATPAARVDGPAPAFLRPVGGPVLTPFGVGRDTATGAWIFRAAATFGARQGEQVRSPADARVQRVTGSVAGGAAVVLVSSGGAAWTLVMSGLESVAVAPGESVGRGDPVGRVGRAGAAAVRVETWRGRTPVDPTAVLRAR